MQRHKCLRPLSFALKITTAVPLMFAVLLLAPSARTEDAHAPNPDNVLVLPKSVGGGFGRWMTVPAATAAPRSTQRAQRMRAKTRTRTAPVAAEAAVSQPQTAEPGWPSAAATVGTATLVPITVRTVREMAAPSPDATLVFENELSDIDLAARPVLTQTSAPLSAPSSALVSTDGRAASDSNASEQHIVFAMTETMKSFTQAAWFEPMLLVLAGALAALSALRLFA